MTAPEFNDRISRLEGLLDAPTAEDALRDAEKWLTQGEVGFARLALIRAKSIQARSMLNAEIGDADERTSTSTRSSAGCRPVLATVPNWPLGSLAQQQLDERDASSASNHEDGP